MRWWHNLTRWRSNHGYGVHSPFAFRFITTVVRPGPYAYYAYPRLDAAAGKDRYQARLLFRILCYFNAPHIIMAGNNPDWVNEAVRLADSRTQIHDIAPGQSAEISWTRQPLFIVGAGSETLKQPILKLILSAIDSGMTAIVRDLPQNAGIIDIISASMKHGMIFYDYHTAVVASRPDLPRQDFRITL